jgi:hypothetical protein
MMWRYARDFFRVPDAVRQELPCASHILQSILSLNDAQLRALARCSSLNVEKLTKRLVFGPRSQALVTFAGLLAAVKGIKEVFGLDLAAYIQGLMPIYIKELVPISIVAALIYISFILVMASSSMLRLIRISRALDEIISIEVAARNLKQ